MYRKTTGRVRLQVDKLMNQIIQSKTSPGTNLVSGLLSQPCCCEISFSPSHASCITNMATLVFLDFPWNPVAALFASEKIAAPTRMMFACVPELERVRNTTSNSWCVLFGWSNIVVRRILRTITCSTFVCIVCSACSFVFVSSASCVLDYLFENNVNSDSSDCKSFRKDLHFAIYADYTTCFTTRTENNITDR